MTLENFQIKKLVRQKQAKLTIFKRIFQKCLLFLKGGRKMGMLIEDRSLRDKLFVFEDRMEAGNKLAEKLLDYKNTVALILAVPSGGVPIGKKIRKVLACEFDLLIVRKAQIPWDTEAGFGAVNLDGDIVLNNPLLATLRLTDEEIDNQIEKTRVILEKRNSLFRKDKEFPALRNKTVIIADDGLASGYTMQAAIRFVKKREPSQIIVAVPTGLADTVETILKEVDVVACLNVRSGYPYAVASAYRNWYDLTDSDVLRLLDDRQDS